MLSQLSGSVADNGGSDGRAWNSGSDKLSLRGRIWSVIYKCREVTGRHKKSTSKLFYRSPGELYGLGYAGLCSEDEKMIMLSRMRFICGSRKPCCLFFFCLSMISRGACGAEGFQLRAVERGRLAEDVGGPIERSIHKKQGSDT